MDGTWWDAQNSSKFFRSTGQLTISTNHGCFLAPAWILGQQSVPPGQHRWSSGVPFGDWSPQRKMDFSSPPCRWWSPFTLIFPLNSEACLHHHCDKHDQPRRQRIHPIKIMKRDLGDCYPPKGHNRNDDWGHCLEESRNQLRIINNEGLVASAGK